MKKIIAYVLCLCCAATLFAGCNRASSPTDPTNPTATPTAPDPTDPTTVLTPTDPVNAGSDGSSSKKDSTAYFTEGTPLNAQELTWFNDQFFSPIWADSNGKRIFNIRNMFLRVQFASAADIDLGILFREGVYENTAATPEEVTALNQKTGDTALLDVVKIPKKDMEEAFLANTGLTIAQTKKNGLEKLTYLESYAAYFHKHGDTAYSLYEIKEGVRMKDGSVILLYKEAKGSNRPLMKVTLMPSGNSYVFVSNLPAE